MDVKSCEESGIWDVSHCAPACLLCFLCKESNGVSFVNCSRYFGEAVIENVCQILTVQRPKTCWSLLLMGKKIARFKKAKSLPSPGPPASPYGSVQTVSAFLRKLCWDRLNYFFVQGTRHQHKQKNTENNSLLCVKPAFILMQISCMNFGVLGVCCLFAVFLYCTCVGLTTGTRTEFVHLSVVFLCRRQALRI